MDKDDGNEAVQEVKVLCKGINGLLSVATLQASILPE